MIKSDIQAQIQAKKATTFDLIRALETLEPQRNDLIQKLQSSNSEINDLELKLAETPEEVATDTSSQTEIQPENVV